MSKKIIHHVKQISLNLKLREYNENNSNQLFDKMISTYKEYRLEDEKNLRVTVTKVFENLIKSQQSDNSLNKIVSSSYNSSQRSRPVEDKKDDEFPIENSIDAYSGIKRTSISSIHVGNTPKRKRNEKEKLEELVPVEPVIQNITKKSFRVVTPKSSTSDLAGIENILNHVRDMVFYPMTYPHIYSHLGARPPCGLLLHGPSGCGKTALALAIAGELGIPFFKASGPELIGGQSGDSEENIRLLFQEAVVSAPSIIFIDNIDVIADKKQASSQRGMDKRVVAQLTDCIDGIADGSDTEHSQGSGKNLVIFLAATNKADSLDPGVRGRFCRELALPVPDAAARHRILQLMTAPLRLGDCVDLRAVGQSTPGFVGADLRALVREAGMLAVSRIVATGDSEQYSSVEGNTEQQMEVMLDGQEEVRSTPVSVLESEIDSTVTAVIPPDWCVTMDDLSSAAKRVQPAAQREGFATVPDVSWDDVGALAAVRQELQHNVLEPIAHPERFRRLGLDVPAGVLFFGPPGCGKTLLAKALANESGANFISVKGPELLNMFVGESESRVRQVFSRARASAPCVVFFDELDALCPKRGSGFEGGSGVTERVVNQLLTEMDGLESRKDVYVIAATNRLELIDDAMLRPGRLGKLLYVPLPVAEDRVSILVALCRRVSLCVEGSERVDLEAIGRDNRCDGFSGADLAALLREAGLAVLQEYRTGPAEVELSPIVGARHFETALQRVRPSVAAEDRLRYEAVRGHIAAGMGAIQALRLARDAR